MSHVPSKVQPRYFVYSRSETDSSFLPGLHVHRVEVNHDDTSPRPLRGPLHYEGFAVYDVEKRKLVRLLVFIEPEHLLMAWSLPPPTSIDDIPVCSRKDRFTGVPLVLPIDRGSTGGDS